MTDMERAAYLYCADMHNLAAHNPDLVKRLYDALIAVPTTTVDNPDDYVKQLGADENALLGITCD
ncbi:family B DNA polymerase, partial [Caballeronia sp. GaOx3]|uniref:family B DNA polymerase n=1 Tax=Caballeronia sp. GaOx3 TaxID=2921740 RepID=UPI0020288BAF